MKSETEFQGKLGKYFASGSRPLAFGRASVLFEGIDEKGKEVCIKVFREPPRSPSEKSLLNEFVQELVAQKALNHPPILPILDYGEGTLEDPAPFLVLPLCKKGNLRQLIDQRAFTPLDEALVFLQQVGSAIDQPHQLGFIHGDIKPENILLGNDLKHAYLCDFGMSKYFSVTERVTSKVGGEKAGSSAYLSPEQIERGKLFTSSDIYSFGVVAYELLVGELPFDVEAPPFAQMRQKIEGKLIDPHDLNHTLPSTARDALIQALKVNTAERPSTALEFCQLLTAKGKKEITIHKPAHLEKGWKKTWSSMENTHKAAIITATLTAIAGIVTALVTGIMSLGKK